MKVQTTVEWTEEERLGLGNGEKATIEEMQEFQKALWEAARGPLVKKYLEDRLRKYNTENPAPESRTPASQ